MIYLFAGDDTKKKIQNYEKFLESLPKDLEMFFVVKNDFKEDFVESLASGPSLFFKKCAVVLAGIFEDEDKRNFLFEKINLFEESENLFIFNEGVLKKEDLDMFKKHRTEINYFELPKEKKEKYNNFILANDFGMGDKKNLWLHFRQAVDFGVGLEELVGVLFWKVKDMILKKSFYKYKEERLKEIGAKLSVLLISARSSQKDAELEFEKFLIEVFG